MKSVVLASILPLLLILSGCAKKSEVDAIKKEVSYLGDEASRAKDELWGLRYDVDKLKERVTVLKESQDSAAHEASLRLIETVKAGNAGAKSTKEDSEFLFTLETRIIKLESAVGIKADAVELDDATRALDKRLEAIEKRLRITNP